jgi:2-oxoisovalerate dehydrogenase E1 component
VVVGAKNWITPPYEFDKYFFPQKEWILDAIHQQILPLPGYVPAYQHSEAAQIYRAKLGV